VSDYGLVDRGSIPDSGRGFFFYPCVQTGSGAHPASYSMGTGGPFPGGKARSGSDADHSPLSSAEVKNEQELYLLSPHAPPWRVAGSLYNISLSFPFHFFHLFPLVLSLILPSFLDTYFMSPFPSFFSFPLSTFLPI
jgi:hypothetical protein